MLIVMAMSINLLLSPAMSLLPLLVSEHFGGNEIQLALLNSIMGIGMLVGGLILSVWGGFKRRIFTTYLGLILCGLAILVVGLTPSHLFSLAAGAFAISMLLLPMINGPIHAVTQATVAPEVQGRVFALISAGSMLAMPIGLSIAGPVSDAIGIQAWFIIGAIVMSLAGVIGFLTPAMRDIENQGKTISESPTPSPQEAQPVPVDISDP
jgi:DHA3 family macrolide efflux protein-like MFS transporter